MGSVLSQEAAANHSATILSQVQRVTALIRSGELTEANSALVQAEGALLPTDSPLARIAVLEARISLTQQEPGAWGKTQTLLEAAERMAEASGNPDLHALVLITRANTCNSAQRYDEALTTLHRLQQLPGLSPHRRTQALATEAVTQHYIGQLEAAKSASLAGLAATHDDVPLEATLRSNLALTLFRMDEKDEALRHSEAVIKALTDMTLERASTLALSSAHLTRAIIRSASPTTRTDYARAIQLLEDVFGPQSPNLIDTLNTQGWGLITLGELTEAEAALNRGLALAQRNRVLPFHQLPLLENFTLLRHRQQRPDEARALAAQMRDIWAAWVPLVLESGSEAARLNLLQQSHWVSTAIAAGDAEQAVTAILSNYGAVLDSLLRDTALAARLRRDQRQRYFQSQAKLAALTLRSDTPPQEVTALRRILQATAPPSPPLQLASLQASLPKDSALIVYTPYRSLDGTPTERLAAAVLTTETLHLVLLPASCNAVRSVGDALLDTLQSPVKEKIARKHLDDLQAALITPLNAAIGSATKLFLCPDGSMSRVPATLWAAAQDPKSAVTFLTSPRALLRKAPAPAPLPQSATWMLVNTGHAELKFTPHLPFPYDIGNEFKDHILPALPGTDDEVSALSQANPERWGILCTQLDDQTIGEPTESAFTAQLIDPPAVIHIAGHAAHKDPGLESATGNSSWWQGLEQPRALWTSCLFFPQPQPTPEDLSADDYLFAAEIAALDLTGTQLVTLSACQTGAGPSPLSEGHYSLARAFHSAGVRDVISATEAIPDGPTVDLMLGFYQKLEQGEDAAQAFWETQQRAIGNDLAKLRAFGFFRLTRTSVATSP